MAKKALIQDPNDILINEQDELQQILGKTPGWPLQLGISLMAIFFAGIFIGAYYIRYPDVVEAPALLLSESPPLDLVSPYDGRIKKVYVTDRESIEPGQLIFELEGTGLKEDILKLEASISPLIRLNTYSALDTVLLPLQLKLGDQIQPYFSTLNQTLKNLQYQLEKDNTQKHIRSIRYQIKELQALNGSLKSQEGSLQKQFEVAQNQVETYSKLEEKGSSSEEEIEKYKSQLFQLEALLEAKNGEQISNKLNIRKLETQILELYQKEDQHLSNQFIQFQEALNQLNTQINEWKQHYLIFSSQAGIIDLSVLTSRNEMGMVGRFIKGGQPLGTIDPKNKKEAVVWALLPPENSGKVDYQQEVHVRLKGYPYKEFGYLVGQVSEISLTTQEQAQSTSSYRVQISLKEGLTTNQGKRLAFRQEMEATARIITEKRNILERIFEQLIWW